MQKEDLIFVCLMVVLIALSGLVIGWARLNSLGETDKMTWSPVVNGEKAPPDWANQIQNALGDGKPTQATSYGIFKDGDDYKARDGATGKIEKTDADAATVIQWAINALPERIVPYGGGTIFLKGKVFDISHKIVVDRPLQLIGVGDGDVVPTLKATSGMNDRLLEVYKAGTNFRTIIKNILINGNKEQQTAGDYLVYFYGGYHVVENVYVMYAYDGGLYLYGQDSHFRNVYVEFADGIGWTVNAGQNNQFYSCTAWSCGTLGFEGNTMHRFSLVDLRIMKNAGDAGIYLHGCYNGEVRGCYIKENEKDGAYLYNCKNLKVLGNDIIDNGKSANNTYYGLKMHTCTYNTISLNHILSEAETENKMKYGIFETTASDYNKICLNTLYGAVTAQISTTGSNTEVYRNIGFATENSGITGAIATGTAVNHGLAGTPTSVTVTAAESGPTDIYVDTVGATSFKINFGGGGNKTFYWYAEYKP